METVELAYEELGSKNAVPLLILHGFFASSRNWRKIAEKLSTLFHVYVLDLRNHGNSPHHEFMDYQSMVADILRFMDTHHLPAAHVMGHSMGGKCAMWLALNYPQRVNRLLVVDIAPKSYVHSFNRMIQALINLPLDEIHNRKQAEVMLAEDITELEYRQFLLQNLILKDSSYIWRINLNIFMAMAANIVAFPKTQGSAPYQGKTLFIAGEDSKYVSEEDTLQLFPESQFRIIANAGHWLHVQKPEVFTEVVENFLQRG
jgi:esterase